MRGVASRRLKAGVGGGTKSGPGLRGRVLKLLPASSFGSSSLILPCSVSPRQKKSKISASRKLQLKVRCAWGERLGVFRGRGLEVGWGFGRAGGREALKGRGGALE